ncbi:putative double-glycine peptidase [Mycoplasma yeatsii]|uniref:Double-glycine peptidase n=2 Tax=Mycoplasma yeatsii TaxID=51365 RepID=A0ABU0NED4_9MOLU|nr:putative double-glycine peptidase [Mycoplasma yeatsii]
MIFIKLVKQTQNNDCSIACLAMVINYYYNQNYDVDRLKVENNYNDESLSFFDINNLSEKYFLKTTALEIEQDLEQVDQQIYLAQVINQAGMVHFVVVEKQKYFLVVYDPSKTKKEKFTYNDFYKIFTGYILVFKSNKRQFLANYNHIKSIFYNFNLTCIAYILINLFSVLLVVLEMRFLYIYSSSFLNKNNSISIYLYFLFIFLINITIGEISKILLNSLYKKNKAKKTKLFYNYLIENNTKLDLVNSYSEIRFLASFETLNFLSLISSFISSIVILSAVYYVNKTIFLVLLVFDLIWLTISFIYKLVTENKSIENKETNFISSLFNKNTLFDKDNIFKTIDSLDQTKLDILNVCFSIVEKISLLVIYFVSWELLKFNYLEFSLLIIVILFKSIHSNDLKKVIYFVENYSKYKQIATKFKNYDTKIEYQEFENINSFELKDLSTDKHFIFNNKINVISNEYKLNLLTKDINQIDHILVLINDLNIKNISKLSLKKHIKNLDDININYSTIFQNIIVDANKENIFENEIIKNLLTKYNINLIKIINSHDLNKKEYEIIKLLRIFYLNSQYILLKDDFEILEKQDIENVLKLFENYNSNTRLITTFNYTQV